MKFKPRTAQTKRFIVVVLSESNHHIAVDIYAFDETGAKRSFNLTYGTIYGRVREFISVTQAEEHK